jgi:flagellar basal-body rod modification protein FlgD
MASSVNALSGASAASSGTSSTTSLASPDKELFLKLLVAQIKNQDPLNPADSMQFVSQLAQFSELEQVIAIRTAVEGQAAGAKTTETTATGGN